LTNLLFACFENVPISQEERLHLVNAAWGDEDEIENGKESQLEAESPVSDFPEGETAEKSRKHVENNLVPHIVLDKNVSLHKCCNHQRSGKIPVIAKS
jgi:hypothetical protein